MSDHVFVSHYRPTFCPNVYLFFITALFDCSCVRKKLSHENFSFHPDFLPVDGFLALLIAMSDANSIKNLFLVMGPVDS